MDELGARALLTRLGAQPAPSPTLDVDTVVELARRRRTRFRRTTAAVAAAVVVLAGAVGVVAVRTGDGRPAPVASPEVVAPTRFDPLHHRLTVGWWPEGYRYEEHGARLDSEWISAATGPNTPGIVVRLYPRGAGLPADVAPPESHPVPGPEVGGRPSTWYYSEFADSGQLRWQWASGATATVDIVLASGQKDPRGVARRVAESVRGDDDTLVALPFTVTRPAQYAIRHTEVVDYGHDVYGATVSFGRRTVDGIEVHLLPAEAAAVTFTPNTTVDGRPAMLTGTGAWTSVRVRFGTELVEVKGRPDPDADTATNRLMVRTACLATAESIRVPVDQTDPSTWPTSPIR